MNTLKKDRKNYTLQMHVVRLHCCKSCWAQRRKRKITTYTFLLIVVFCCYLKTCDFIKYPALRPKPAKSTIGYKSSQANNEILNKLDSNLDSYWRTMNLMFDPPTLWKTKAKCAWCSLVSRLCSLDVSWVASYTLHFYYPCQQVIFHKRSS